MKLIPCVLLQAILLLNIFFVEVSAQGLNHQWLIGYQTSLDTNVTAEKARFLFDSASYSLIGEQRKMQFRATQGNISDENGNLLMVSNGCWIANALNDTMLNGAGLNPGAFTSTWCGSSFSALPFPHANVFLPYPEDTTKYILFHQTGNSNVAHTMSTELFYSVIDMTLDGGHGGVTLQKNVVALQDTLSLGIAACRHSNGRDWWVVVLKDSSDLIYKILLTPTGISSITTQNLNVPFAWVNVNQPTFSPDGNKFAYTFSWGNLGAYYHDVRLFNFDRCTGNFSNPLLIDLTDTHPGLSVAFSSNSKYLYAASTVNVYQINTDTSNIIASIQIVAVNDTFYSPVAPLVTDFWLMYLAANGKIYISSGNSVIDMHFINHPDSSGMDCDVQQHAIHLPCWYFRGNVNHPNYYLGCDTTGGCTCLTGINNLSPPDFRFRIYPNPVTAGYLNIGYLLPQNKSGTFQIYDITGKVVFKYTLPPWSNEQSFLLAELSDGIYNCVITSGKERVSKKIAVIKE